MPQPTFAIEIAWKANLVANHGFEANTTGWTTGGGNTIAVSTEQKRFGSQSGKATAAATVNAILAAYAFTAEAAKLHTLIAWLYIPTAYDGTLLRLEASNFSDATGALNVNADMNIRDAWQHLTVTFTTVADLAGELKIAERGTLPTAGRGIYIDGAQAYAHMMATAHLRKCTVNRGRRAPLGPVAPGSCQLVLQNRDRQYSPENASSPFVNNLKPRRAVTIVAKSTTKHEPLFVGRVDDIKIEVKADDVSEATIECLDDLAFAFRESGPVYTRMTGATEGNVENVKTAQAVDRLLTDLDWPTGDREYSGGTAALTGMSLLDTYWASGQDALAAFNDLVNEEIGLGLITKAGNVRFEGREFRFSTARATAVATYDDTAGATFRYAGLAPYTLGLEHVYNDARAKAQPRRNDVQVRIWRLPTVPLLQDEEQHDYWATWDNPATVTQIAGAYGTLFTANSAANGSGVDLAAQIIHTYTLERGATRWLQRLRNVGPLPAYITLLQASVLPRVADGEPVEFMAEDAASQADYGVRVFPGGPRWIGALGEAEDWAGVAVMFYKQPTPIIDMSFRPYSLAMLNEMMAREIGERVNVESAELGLDNDFFIEGLSYQLNNGAFTSKALLSKVHTDLQPFRFDDATFGRFASVATDTGYGRFFG